MTFLEIQNRMGKIETLLTNGYPDGAFLVFYLSNADLKTDLSESPPTYSGEWGSEAQDYFGENLEINTFYSTS